MTEKNEYERADKSEAGKAVDKSPALTIDYELYEQYLDDSDLSEAQKREFLETLWNIIVSFVDLGFGVHPLQQAASDKCEQNQNLTDFFPLESGNMVEYRNNPKSDFNGVADEQSDALAERRQK